MTTLLKYSDSWSIIQLKVKFVQVLMSTICIKLSFHSTFQGPNISKAFLKYLVTGRVMYPAQSLSEERKQWASGNFTKERTSVCEMNC